MTKKQAEFIVEAAENEGLSGVEIYKNYSGRGMYGDTTFAITADNLPDLFAATLRFALEEETDGENEGLLDNFDLCQDSMGLGVVIY